MATRQSTRKQRRCFAASVAIVALVYWHAGPALASNEVDAKGATESAITVEAVSPDALVAPRVGATLRKALDKQTMPVADTDKPDADKQPVMNTRVPGVSDENLAQFKRQMYRTDI